MKANKYKYVYILQTNYGTRFEDEFEFSDEEGYDTMKDRKSMLKCYRDNQPQYSHRIINRRVLNKGD